MCYCRRVPAAEPRALIFDVFGTCVDWRGSIIAEGRPFFQRAPWVVLYPGIFLALLILSVNLFGDALRDRHDPRMARQIRS